MDRHTDIQTDTQTDTHTDRHTHIQTPYQYYNIDIFRMLPETHFVVVGP